MRIVQGCLIALLTALSLTGISSAQEPELKSVSSTVPEIDSRTRPEIFFYLVENINNTYRRSDFKSFGKAWESAPYLSDKQTVGVDEIGDGRSYWIYERDYSKDRSSIFIGFRISVENISYADELYIGNIKKIIKRSGWKLEKEEYTEFDGKQVAYLVFIRDGVRLICSRDIPPLPEHPWFYRPGPASENAKPDEIKIETIRFEIDL